MNLRWVVFFLSLTLASGKKVENDLFYENGKTAIVKIPFNADQKLYIITQVRLQGEPVAKLILQARKNGEEQNIHIRQKLPQNLSFLDGGLSANFNGSFFEIEFSQIKTTMENAELFSTVKQNGKKTNFVTRFQLEQKTNNTDMGKMERTAWVWGPPAENYQCGPTIGDCRGRCCSQAGWCGSSSDHCTNPKYDFRPHLRKTSLEESFPANTVWIYPGTPQIGSYSLHIVDKSSIYINIEEYKNQGLTLHDGSPVPDKLYLEDITIDENEKEFKGSIKFNGNPPSWGLFNVDSWELIFPYGNAIEEQKISCSERQFGADGTEVRYAGETVWTLFKADMGKMERTAWVWGPPADNYQCGPTIGDCRGRCCSSAGWCGSSSDHCTNPKYDFRPHNTISE